MRFGPTSYSNSVSDSRGNCRRNAGFRNSGGHGNNHDDCTMNTATEALS